MFAKKNGRSARCTALLAAVHMFALCTTAAGGDVEVADQQTLRSAARLSQAPQAHAELEHAFWVCDYVATTYGIQAAPVVLCSEVTTALQNQKFGGDFSQMLAWWRENKLLVHGQLQWAQRVAQP